MVVWRKCCKEGALGRDQALERTNGTCPAPYPARAAVAPLFFLAFLRPSSFLPAKPAPAWGLPLMLWIFPCTAPERRAMGRWTVPLELGGGALACCQVRARRTQSGTPLPGVTGRLSDSLRHGSPLSLFLASSCLVCSLLACLCVEKSSHPHFPLFATPPPTSHPIAIGCSKIVP